jgi:hypothetical protein
MAGECNSSHLHHAPHEALGGAGADQRGGGRSADVSCPICLAEVEGHLLAAGDPSVCRLRCGHRYHTACIESWLARSSTCPVCRRDASAGAHTRAVGGAAATWLILMIP